MRTRNKQQLYSFGIVLLAQVKTNKLYRYVKTHSINSNIALYEEQCPSVLRRA